MTGPVFDRAPGILGDKRITSYLWLSAALILAYIPLRGSAWQSSAQFHTIMVVAHDLLEPLRKALSLGDRIKLGCADNLPEDGQSYVDRMQGAASIFEVFKSLHGRSEYTGSGIGLSICRRFVERHHGRISAVGHPGEGAEFRISLPVQQAKQEVTHAAA